MTLFGQSKMVIVRNQPSLFDPQNGRDIAGTNRDNRDILTGGEGHEPGHSGTPPLKGGVQCPDGSGSGMSRVPCPGSQALKKRNDEKQPDPADAYPTRVSIKAAFDQWTADGQPWPPPTGLTSAIASHLIPRRTKEHRTWRK